jgi:hypothetical protein
VVKGDGTIGHRSSVKAVFGVKRTPFSVVMNLACTSSSESSAAAWWFKKIRSPLF